ncbi:MAG: MFS transporter [Alphaproteobacteria bacterium]|nr:MFS transporter [Alphaproteobacteria bacterium]
MSGDTTDVGWLALFKLEWLPALAMILGGVLLHSMNVLLVATVLPSIVGEVGGAPLMSWPSTAFLASSIIAATCSSLLSAVTGPSRAFCVGAVIFCAGTLLCAVAPSMGVVIAGRFVQGFGGGVLAAVAYVLVRGTFPAVLWPRVFGMISVVWTVSIVVGPLVGGIFAALGIWRGAFYVVTVLAGMLAIGAWAGLPVTQSGVAALPRVPAGRVALVCLAIAAMSFAAVVETPVAKASQIMVALAALAVMLRLDRRATVPLLPSDAFALNTATGAGLWIVLLVCLAFNPLQIYVPIFLQRLHGLDSLTAGYAVAGASMAWSIAALAVAGLSGAWSARLIIAGPVAMAAGLAGIAALISSGPLLAIVHAIALIGIGIGVTWAFTMQRIMGEARPGEEDVAASSIAIVQQTGMALGAALAGLAANTAGFSIDADFNGIARAAIWVPASLVPGALAAALMGVLLRRTGRQGR